ncbi:MAG: two-component sensor histidine kinase, partial [Bacteroidetes bacterium]|nr:two-component sensor histidine kinase [Bacteroidota bacterium]
MKRPFIIFYAIIVYAVSELIWWGYMLVRLQPKRTAMILGEGSVF